jgi:hypothetical protein
LIELGADNPYDIGESENEEETEADLDGIIYCATWLITMSVLSHAVVN